jgi:hypothetical protein
VAAAAVVITVIWLKGALSAVALLSMLWLVLLLVGRGRGPTLASVVMRLLMGPSLMGMGGLDLCWCDHDCSGGGS